MTAALSASAALLTRALDPDSAPPQDPASTRILDAALALAAASGVRNLTMDDVAARAGVGRMTVYRRFGTRERLLEALALRECRACLAEIDTAADPALPVSEQIAEGFVTALGLSRDHPLLNRLARHEPDAVLEAVAADDGLVLKVMRAFLAARISASAQRGEATVADPEQAAELLIRVCLSFVLVQDSVIDLGDDDAARRFARTLIAPILTAPR